MNAVDSAGETALMLTMRIHGSALHPKRCTKDRVDLLLQHDANVEFTNALGETALQLHKKVSVGRLFALSSSLLEEIERPPSFRVFLLLFPFRSVQVAARRVPF